MKTLAIIGAGIAGLGCGHFLHRVRGLTMYERSGYAGGHANTVTAESAGRSVRADTGFLTFTKEASPGLTRLLSSVGAGLHAVPVSYSVRDETTGIEWTGPSPLGIFHHPSRLFSRRHWRAYLALGRLGREAHRALQRPETRETSLAQFLQRQGYGDDLIELCIAPMSAALWGTTPELLLGLPADAFLRHLQSQGMLWGDTCSWHSVNGGSADYIRRMTEPWRDRIRVGCQALRIERGPGGVTVHAADGSSRRFDQVILATHADQALQLLADPTADEKRILGEFRYQRNLASLHTDERVMPRRKRTWAGCNLQLSRSADGRLLPSAHYWLNRLQGLSENEHYIVSIGRPEQIEPRKVLRGIHYETPMQSLWALRAQNELPGLNLRAAGGTETYFAGSYFKTGSHEDALQSAVQLCELLLGRDPWVGS